MVHWGVSGDAPTTVGSLRLLCFRKFESVGLVRETRFPEDKAAFWQWDMKLVRALDYVWKGYGRAHQ